MFQNGRLFHTAMTSSRRCFASAMSRLSAGRLSLAPDSFPSKVMRISNRKAALKSAVIHITAQGS
jgi:hypothetical protein